LILYESPHRLIKGMEELNTYFGSERLCCASKEISKLFEAHYYGTLGEVLTTLKALPKILGEWVICIEGKPH
ncbi:MAG: 16S rRNA (cytidine(1402)-2'-O)-methyltransferase, partial [Bacteroidia bacterium]|nr:16S rRNA (cytidine(1402)-2'-O)-methyltransferase [Bacteroidia bacterium]